MNIEDVSVRVSSNTSEPVSAVIQVTTFSHNQRLSRGLKTLGVFWAISAFTVLIPIAHFVLVPLFFVIGPIAASVVYKKTSKIVGGSIPCPICKHAFEIAQNPVTWPAKEICSHCRGQIRLTPQL